MITCVRIRMQDFLTEFLPLMVHGHTNIQPRRSYVATLPLSRSKGQGYQAALPSAALTCKAAAAVSVGTYSAWESTSTLRLLCGARGAWAPTGRRGAGHIVSPRAQLVFNEFNLHERLPGITCFRLQVIWYTCDRSWQSCALSECF